MISFKSLDNTSLTSKSTAVATTTAAADYAYFRFVFTKVINGNEVQMQRIRFYNNGVEVSLSSGTATSNTPIIIGEEPKNVITPGAGKWCSIGLATLLLTFPTALTMTQYTITTASDASQRDPVSWTLSASTNNVIWTQIDSQTNYASMPAARLTETPLMWCIFPTKPYIDGVVSAVATTTFSRIQFGTKTNPASGRTTVFFKTPYASLPVVTLTVQYEGIAYTTNNAFVTSISLGGFTYNFNFTGNPPSGSDTQYVIINWIAIA